LHPPPVNLQQLKLYSNIIEITYREEGEREDGKREEGREGNFYTYVEREREKERESAWEILWTGEPGGLQSMGLQESDTTW